MINDKATLEKKLSHRANKIIVLPPPTVVKAANGRAAGPVIAYTSGQVERPG